MPIDLTFTCPHPHKRGCNHCWDCDVAARRFDPVETAQRFWTLVPDRPDAPDRCWLWTGRQTTAGYGAFTWNRRQRAAHRIAFMLTHGSAPRLLRHLCDVPLCVRPAHLLAGTDAENVADAIARGTHNDTFTRKLTDADVLAIRARRAGGSTFAELSAAFNVSRHYVQMICLGRVRVLLGSGEDA